MLALRERDVGAALELVYDAASYDGPEPFPQDFLEQLARLVRADALAGYHEAAGSRNLLRVEIPPGAVSREVADAGRELYRQDPLNHCRRAREHRVLKLSDFFTPRQLRKLDHYWMVWRPLGIDDSLRVWLPAPAGHARTLYFERSRRQFNESERALLQVLRPSLVAMLHAASRRHPRVSDQEPPLTARETEILGWISRGKTTREIAEALLLSPHTVRKHVEHILEKLGVATRSAAVARAAALGLCVRCTSSSRSRLDEAERVGAW